MRIPFPVEPSLLLMLMTMFVPSCAACCQLELDSVDDESTWKREVDGVGEGEFKARRAIE